MPSATSKRRNPATEYTPGGPRLFDQVLDRFAVALETPDEAAGVAAERARYRADPAAWLIDILGVERRSLYWNEHPAYHQPPSGHRWDGNKDPLVQVCRGLAAGKNVGVESATGTGKTFLLAGLILWFLEMWDGARVVTLAPKEDQLKLHLWAEISKFWPRFKARHPRAHLGELVLRMRPDRKEWGAWGFPVGVGADEKFATKAAGFHAEHMLIVTEETPGINLAIMNTMESTCTAPHNIRLAVGNPDSQQDALHQFCLKSGTVALRISALDHPNVVAEDSGIVPGAISAVKLAERRADYGDDSPLYLSRGRGISPQESESALIKRAWCRDAATNGRREAVGEDTTPAAGVDVANSKNGDRAAIAFGRGCRLLRVQTWPCPNVNLFASDRVVPLIRDEGIAAQGVGIDVIGVGAGAVNELLRLGYKVQSLVGNAKPIPQPKQQERFQNLRAQMWWQLRLDLQSGRIALPDDAELIDDLTSVQWDVSNGMIRIKSKDEIRKLIGRSPDRGDACAYWNWVRQKRQSLATIGGALVTM